jgi:hypothetical protein
MKLITLILVPWFGMSGAIGLLLLQAFLVCAGTALYFLSLYKNITIVLSNHNA